MPRILLASLFAFASSLVVAAPPKSAKPPPADPASAPADDIDVDALARAKDVGATPPAETEAPTQPVAPEPAEPAASPADEAEAAPAEAAAANAPPDAMKADTNAPPSTDEKSIAESCRARAIALLDAVQKGDYAAATRDFDAKMAGALPPAKLEESWRALDQFGKLDARGQPHLGKGGGYTVVMIPLIFEKRNLVAETACGSDGRIAGFYVKPIYDSGP